MSKQDLVGSLDRVVEVLEFLDKTGAQADAELFKLVKTHCRNDFEVRSCCVALQFLCRCSRPSRRSVPTC